MPLTAAVFMNWTSARRWRKTGGLTTGDASLAGRPISPHTVRLSTAMFLLQSGVDISVIALWLGHSREANDHHQCIEADLAMKEKALSKLQDPGVVALRFRADDSLLDFLKSLCLCMARGRGGSPRSRERRRHARPYWS